MATLDLHEQEQVDALKAWWQENGKWMLAALVVALASFVGVRGWQGWKAGEVGKAAVLYESVVQQVTSNDAKRVDAAAQAVVDKYGSTVYAPRAELLAAQVSMQVGEGKLAQRQLHWVIDHAAEAGMQSVASLKLASLLLDAKKYDEALGLLEAKHPQSFDGLYADMRGDVLLAQGKKGEARTAYKAALDKTREGDVYRSLIRMKLDSLGGAK